MKLARYSLLAAISLLLLAQACQKVPLTGRRQLHLLPSALVMNLSFTSYSDFLKTHPPLPQTHQTSLDVRETGIKISQAVTQYMKDHAYSSRLQGYQWEFQAVDNKEANAWCMPGGKVVVYTGIMPMARDKEGLAVVMGHEIAHAVAGHGNERMSQLLAMQLGGLSLELAMQNQPEKTRDIFLMAYGVGSTLGQLAYSRQHELEADRLGLIFMAMAGYNPQRAITFWQEMAAAGGNKPPEFLSTHPSDTRRIAQIKKYLPEAMKYYKP
ncbi:MAG TPA: M48 family metallopeptidase [Bacteroidales bacterium]|nr:M48 family metallopeptidase [Bacteroidales bacterium]HSA42658.1 M48 family metallopeptidase [Bacteroidales bacterium]